MAVTKLEINELLAFAQAKFEFCPGINVLIGENSTGKTHAMKLMYTMLRSAESYRRDQIGEEAGSKPAAHLSKKLAGVFRPDGDEVGRLVRRGIGRKKGSAEIAWESNDRMKVTISTLGKVTRTLPKDDPPQTTFITSRELLAAFPGFIAAYENRELEFDETYYDMAKALSAAPLRGPRGEKASHLIEPLLKILKGRIVLQGGRFLLHAKAGNLEAHLLSEGLRKIGTLAHLISNGSLAKQSVLFWDEPEASLNPKAVTVIAAMLLALAGQGVQIFLATHDFLLSQELSLAAEYKSDDSVSVRFFALSRGTDAGVSVAAADTLADLEGNPILREFEAYYDREQQLFAKSATSKATEANRADDNT